MFQRIVRGREHLYFALTREKFEAAAAATLRSASLGADDDFIDGSIFLDCGP